MSKQNSIRIVFPPIAPIRLDKYLVELRIQELYSRAFIERLIQDDKILVNNTPIKKSYILQEGDEIQVNVPELADPEVIPQDIPLDVVYEDDELAIINKEPGMTVHPGYGVSDQTLVNAIVFKWGNNLSSGRETNRPGIVHRLDRGTSGLLLIAKNDRTQSAMSEMFARREIEKTYLAITCGIPDPSEGEIATYITRSLSNPRKMCVADSGRWSLTRFKVAKFYHCFTLTKVKLETGRMHQIRVHFAHTNLPLLGDLLYNTRRQVHALVPENMKRKVTELLTTHLHRQALHAWRLQFVHPISKNYIDVSADPPEDFQYTIKWLDEFFAIDTDNRDLKRVLLENKDW